MNLVKTYIDRSEIEGIGMFAGQFIPKGTLIWKLNSDIDLIYPRNNYDELSKNWSEIEKHYFNRYVFEDSENYYFCSDDAKYCNHSFTPNTGGIEEQIALRDINIGEEITCNYAEINNNEKECWNEEEFKTLISHKPI